MIIRDVIIAWLRRRGFKSNRDSAWWIRFVGTDYELFHTTAWFEFDHVRLVNRVWSDDVRILYSDPDLFAKLLEFTDCNEP